LLKLHHKKHRTGDAHRDLHRALKKETFMTNYQELESGFLWESIYFGGRLDSSGDCNWNCSTPLERCRWPKMDATNLTTENPRAAATVVRKCVPIACFLEAHCRWPIPVLF
jgi:hypothetical protein